MIMLASQPMIPPTISQIMKFMHHSLVRDLQSAPQWWGRIQSGDASVMAMSAVEPAENA
jgi:hypothetical protein